MIQDLCDRCKTVVEKIDLECCMRDENRWFMRLVEGYKIGLNIMGPEGPHGPVALCPECLIELLQKRFPQKWKAVAARVDNSETHKE